MSGNDGSARRSFRIWWDNEQSNLDFGLLFACHKDVPDWKNTLGVPRPALREAKLTLAHPMCTCVFKCIHTPEGSQPNIHL